MSATSAYLESLIDECGGFSKFQMFMFVIVTSSRLVTSWTTIMMTFAGATPNWSCMYEMKNESSKLQPNFTTTGYPSREYLLCYPPQNATSDTCTDIYFDGSMDTVINEWSLICDKEWVSSAIITIQMAGLLVSGLISGHLADTIGRKPTYFSSLIIMLIFNIAAGFSSSWKMFAVFRFLLGLGIGGFGTVNYNILIEFMPAKHRSLAIVFPAWEIWATLFALVSMWLQNWQYLHFATAVCAVPWLLFWRVIPESFRYLVVHGRLVEAGQTIRKIANLNGHPVPDLKRLWVICEEDEEIDKERKYSVKDLICTPQMLKYSVLFGFCWVSCGYGYYAISFGVQRLSGNLYWNMFLMSVVDIPGSVIVHCLSNYFGRKRTTLAFFLLSVITGTVVAAVQLTNLEMKTQLINGFAFASKLCVSIAWATLALLTIESYPTTVRNIGYGLMTSVARIGSMVAPQIIYLDVHSPGMMYFLFAGLMFLSAICVTFVPETNRKPMADVIRRNKKTREAISADQQIRRGMNENTIPSLTPEVTGGFMQLKEMVCWNHNARKTLWTIQSPEKNNKNSF